MRIPLNLAGGTYEHKAGLQSSQRTRNFWPQVQTNPKAKSKYILQSFYGLKTFTTPAIGGVDRGMYENQGTLYKITGTTLYSVSSTGVHTSLGTIAGSNRCVIKAIDSTIVIVNGHGAIYTWNGTTLTLNSDPDIGSPNAVATLNSQAIYDKGTGQIFSVSNAGTPLTVNGLNYASAEVESDALKIPYAYRETLYLMGEETTELWWNSGQGNPPFDKIQGGTIGIGIAAINSAADTPDYIFFLGSDRQVHTLTGGASAVDTIVSNQEMAKIFQDYDVVSDAIGWTMQLEGQWFYSITFPTEDVTWVYPIGGEWFQWGTGREGRIRANSYSKVFGKHLVADYASGNIYELDAQTYTDASETIIRERITAPLHGGLFQADGKDFEIQYLEIILQTGNGDLTTTNPTLMLSISKDGGKTFGTERMKVTGAMGQTATKVLFTNLGRYNNCTLKLSVSDPVYWSIHSAVADVDICV